MLNHVIDAVRDLQPTLRARSDQIENAGHVPDDLFAQLQAVGCFRLLAPGHFDGLEASLPEALQVIELLAEADGSTAWIAGQIASAQLILAHFPAAILRELYTDGPDLVAAGAIAPKGHALRQTDGWRVTGQWPFVTSCERASWIYLQCVLVDDRKLRLAADGAPGMRMMLFPAAQVEILQTWSTVGLCGTASHDARVSSLFCPAEHTADVNRETSCLEAPIYHIHPLDQGGLYIAAVALGIASGALNDVAAIASGGKRPAFSMRRLGESPLFQDQLGSICMELQSVRALFAHHVQKAWTAARERQALTLLERAQLRATVPEVTRVAIRVVDAAYSLAGGTAVYDRNALQRRLRDIHVLGQHAYAGRLHYGNVGSLLAGEKIDESKF